jgi:hypothetical protein
LKLPGIGVQPQDVVADCPDLAADPTTDAFPEAQRGQGFQRRTMGQGAGSTTELADSAEDRL